MPLLKVLGFRRLDHPPLHEVRALREVPCHHAGAEHLRDLSRSELSKRPRHTRLAVPGGVRELEDQLIVAPDAR